jgi:hypothetical protein
VKQQISFKGLQRWREKNPFPGQPPLFALPDNVRVFLWDHPQNTGSNLSSEELVSFVQALAVGRDELSRNSSLLGGTQELYLSEAC